MAYFTHSFEDVIALQGVGKTKVLTYKVLFMPPQFERELPFDVYPRLRVEGEIAEVPVRGAWMPVGDGRRYFIVSPKVKKETGFDVGDLVEMRFRIDDQDHVDIPRSLQLALGRDDAVKAAWDALTAGKKRMFTFHVASAKTEPTEARRVAEAMEAIGRRMTLRDLQTERKSKKKILG
ncbi:MAG: YdeI/OmpD-associated family protein [Pseudomonadota bacterium]